MQWPGRAAHEVLVLDIDKALGLSDGPDVGLLAAAGGGPMGRGEQPRAWGPGQAGTIPPPGQGSMGRRGASGPPLWVGGHPPPPQRGGVGVVPPSVSVCSPFIFNPAHESPGKPTPCSRVVEH